MLVHDVPEFAGGAKWDSEPVLQHYDDDDDMKYDSSELLPEPCRDIQTIPVDNELAIQGIAAAAAVAADDTCGMIARDDDVSAING
jgi:hypothetical protein